MILSQFTIAQNTGYTLKLGPSLGLQKWDYETNARLLAYHIALGVDSESSDGNSIIYGTIGYHVKGGAVRYRGFTDQFGNFFKGDKFDMKFNNVVLEIGVKMSRLDLGNAKTYFGVAGRADYTLSSKFEINGQYKDYVRKFNYGLTFLGGIEYSLGKTIRNGWELRISPDISKQIFVPAGTLWYNPYTKLASRISEISARNLNIEISTYIRLLQIIEYVD